MNVLYKNDFGEYNKNRAALIINNEEQTINLKNLVKVKFVKKQKYHINYLTFLLSIYLLFFIVNNPLSYSFQLIISLFANVLLFTSYFLKINQYRFVLIGRNFVKEIEVSKKMSVDAENLVYQINNNYINL
jgi:hypothetical protein